MIDITKKIKMILIDKELKQSDLSNLLNTTRQNLNDKMKRQTYQVKDLEKIAEVLNCTLEINFINNLNGNKF